jgi:hypothetical protein
MGSGDETKNEKQRKGVKNRNNPKGRWKYGKLG